MNFVKLISQSQNYLGVRLVMIKRNFLFLFSLLIFLLLACYSVWITHSYRNVKQWGRELENQVYDLKKQDYAIIKPMVLRDLGLPQTYQGDLYEFIREVRDKLYHNTYQVNQWEPFNGLYGDVALKYNLLLGRRHPFACGDLSQVYRWVLEAFHIPSRIVQLAAKTFLDDGKVTDSHVYLEIYDGSKWFVSDPTFNAEYYCSDGKGPLSTKEMKNCISEKKQILPEYGKTVFPERKIEAYYIPLEKLLYAYKLNPTKINGKDILMEEHPFPDWEIITMKKYENK